LNGAGPAVKDRPGRNYASTRRGELKERLDSEAVCQEPSGFERQERSHAIDLRVELALEDSIARRRCDVAKLRRELSTPSIRV